jgi:hypothetical protein
LIAHALYVENLDNSIWGFWRQHAGSQTNGKTLWKNFEGTFTLRNSMAQFKCSCYTLLFHVSGIAMQMLAIPAKAKRFALNFNELQLFSKLGAWLDHKFGVCPKLRTLLGNDANLWPKCQK